jgi:integrase
MHGIRHSHAPLRLAKGDNITDVSNQLGHHTIKLAWFTYFHRVAGTQKNQVDELDSLGRSNAPPPHPVDNTRRAADV